MTTNTTAKPFIKGNEQAWLDAREETEVSVGQIHALDTYLAYTPPALSRKLILHLMEAVLRHEEGLIQPEELHGINNLLLLLEELQELHVPDPIKDEG